MNKARQIYGYAVCTIAVIAFLIAMVGLVSALIDLADPLYAGYNDHRNLTSFEHYKVDAMQSVVKDAVYIPTDSELQIMYAAAKEDMIARTMHHVRRDLLASAITIVVCIILFVVHWKLMVRYEQKVAVRSPGGERQVL